MIQHNENKIDHFIVSNVPWCHDGIKFRRHRLAEYLLHHERTSKVYYIYPSGIGYRHPIRGYRNFKESAGILSNGIYQIALPDKKGWVRYGTILNNYICKYFVSKVDRNHNQRYIWYTNPSYAILSEKLSWDRIIYDCSDLWNREPIEKAKLQSEKTIAGNSDVIISTSQYLVDYIKKLFNREATFIENGVDYSFFNQVEPANLPEIPKPRLGFIGGFKRNIDLDLILYLISNLPDVSFVLAGPISNSETQKMNIIMEHDNVHYIGKLDFKSVPSYMKSLDLGLIPYKVNEFNLAGSPNKLFEYLAAGVPVVSQGVANVRKYSQKGVCYVSDSNYEDFLELCTEALSLRDNHFYREKRLEVAQEQDWSKKFDQMFDLVVKGTN
jgi:teichuronic acid biosynthesis glycosyltransferase TuaH